MDEGKKLHAVFNYAAEAAADRAQIAEIRAAVRGQHASDTTYTVGSREEWDRSNEIAERHLASLPDGAALIAERRAWIAQQRESHDKPKP